MKCQLVGGAFTISKLIVFLIFFNLDACSKEAQPIVPNDWNSDCVGLMQLSFPGKVDVAVTPKIFFDNEFGIKTREYVPSFAFDDMQKADYTHINGVGVSKISEIIDTGTIKLYQKAMVASIFQRQKNIEKSLANNKVKVNLVKSTFNDVTALQIGNYFDVITVLNNRAILWGIMDEGTESNTAPFIKFEKSLYLRELGSLPRSIGVCLPYVFLNGSNGKNRNIATTYRLKDHPDVTVWLEDSSAHEVQPHENPDKFTPEYKTEFFWRQEYQDPQKGHLLWDGLHEVSLNNQKGVASFMELTRRDGTVDYGYFAVANGDPKAKEDTPDLRLYVIQDAKNAIAKGKVPMRKDEFLKLAEAIAASVKRRLTE